MNGTRSVRTAAFHIRFEREMEFRPPRIVEKTEHKYIITQERDVSYRLYLHQHPYVQPLVQRLLRKGTSGLQAADTEYNTRARLSNVTPARDGSGALVPLAADTIVYVSDGATATLDGTTVRFAGGKVLGLADEAVVMPEPNKTVTIPAKTLLRDIDGKTFITDADAVAALLDGVPVPVLYSDIFSPKLYDPSASVQRPYPVKDLDFSSGGAYSVYNWELFYHVPITIGMHLSKNERYAEAQRWFHYLFDPTDDSNGPTPERFWKVRPFQTADVRKIQEILVNLVTGADVDLRNETIRSIEAWKDAPFRPHVIARYRHQAYMYKAVMAYLDNLVGWGDSLFRQDTGETIDEALQLYVLAANILGPRPMQVPKQGDVRPQTYDNLRRDLEQFGTAMRDIEPDMAMDVMPPPSPAGDTDRLATLRSLGKALYFCVPRNDKLMGYWDTVADRLFKIRNSLNFQGIFRQLALFEPPIDPALLARAAAAGLDVGAIVNGLHQPLPLVRFSFLIQRAAEIAQEVKALGSNLLAAMEKEDGEAMAILRARHERVVMEMVEHVKYGQLQEATKSKQGLLATLAVAVQRYTFYERQLGKKPDEIQKAIPALGELDTEGLARMKFDMEEQEVATHDIEPDIAQDLGATGGKIISSHENEEFLRLQTAQQLQQEAAIYNTIAKALSLIPELGAQGQPMGVGAAIQFGGRALSTQMSLAADAANTSAGRNSYEAGRAARVGSYARREQDWTFQSNLAAGEINQIFKQLRAAQLREAIAELELKNHRQQMKHAEEIERFLNAEGSEANGKRTNKALYSWMKREVRGLHSQSFQLAFDIARKAERALQHELGDPQLSYLQFGYLAGKEGLLAGEKLYMDIKRMEMAFHEQNRREYELVKHLSLLQVDPLALLRLRATGRCSVQLPEELYDMDGPGHYFRRIKSVAVSIPCVAGPYASVNCTLTLLKSTVRTTPMVGDGYPRVDADDERFSDYLGSLQSIVTSSAQNDSGLFETNLKDERYLPFENSGAISEWQIELPGSPATDPVQFDYETIADVILHIRYTAREGGSLLRRAAVGNFRALADDGKAAGTVRLFSVRQEFPNEWNRFQTQAPGADQRFALELNLRAEHYPYWSQKLSGAVAGVDVLARSGKKVVPATIDVFDKADQADATAKHDTLTKTPTLAGVLLGSLANISLPAKREGDIRLFFDDRELADVWVAMRWSGA